MPSSGVESQIFVACMSQRPNSCEERMQKAVCALIQHADHRNLKYRPKHAQQIQSTSPTYLSSAGNHSWLPFEDVPKARPAGQCWVVPIEYCHSPKHDLVHYRLTGHMLELVCEYESKFEKNSQLMFGEAYCVRSDMLQSLSGCQSPQTYAPRQGILSYPCECSCIDIISLLCQKASLANNYRMMSR